MYCPMFDGNAGATWVQKAGPVTNPYYGKAMLHCGTDMSAGAHEDHSPQFGGVLFMAADAFHHVEGTYTADGMFRAHVYDNFKQPMQVARFKAWLEIGGRTIPLAPSADRLTLDARVGTLAFPAEMTLKMIFMSGGEEERFDFVFESFSPPASCRTNLSATTASRSFAARATSRQKPAAVCRPNRVDGRMSVPCRTRQRATNPLTPKRALSGDDVRRAVCQPCVSGTRPRTPHHLSSPCIGC